MPRRIFDTNILISYWRRSFHGKEPRRVSEDDAVKCAKNLVDLLGDNAILSPIYIKFLCGSRNSRETKNFRAYLDQFEIVDGGRVIERDWEKAKQLAAHVPRDGSRRQMGDCLIRAICVRLNLDVYSADGRFPR